MSGTNPGGSVGECLRVGGRRKWSNRSRGNNRHGCCTGQFHTIHTRRDLLECRQEDADSSQGIVSHVVTKCPVHQVLEARSRACLSSHVVVQCVRGGIGGDGLLDLLKGVVILGQRHNQVIDRLGRGTGNGRHNGVGNG